MPSIGERLRRQRLERGVDLGTIARETKISRKLLEAIEAEDFDKLPGGVFRKSFVRQYAHALGVEESEIAAELDRVAPPEDSLPLPGDNAERLETEIPALPTAASRQNRRWAMTSVGSFAGVLLAMLACAAVYSWWQNSQNAPVKSTAAPPAALESAPAAGSRSPVQPPAAVSQTSTPASTAGAPQASVQSAQLADGQVQPAAPPPQVPAAYTPPPPGKFRVDFLASEPAWVSVVVDGSPVFAGTLEANQGRTFEATSSIRLRIGNAGGLNVNLNGKPIGAIGPRGQVRVVELTPAGSQVLALPAPPAPAEAKPAETTPPQPAAPKQEQEPSRNPGSPNSPV